METISEISLTFITTSELTPSSSSGIISSNVKNFLLYFSFHAVLILQTSPSTAASKTLTSFLFTFIPSLFI